MPPPGHAQVAATRIATAPVADACLRLNLQPRIAPAGLHPVVPGQHAAGPVRPTRHAGSVDVFLEAIDQAQAGDVLVVDNAGRNDEGCVGDLTALEAHAAQLAGLLVWGLHRDTETLRAIPFPVFSYGSIPNGPLSARERPGDALERARFGSFEVTRADYVVADDDGAVFFPRAKADEVVKEALEIQTREKAQAERVRSGDSLRAQFRFKAYLTARSQEPTLTFREHLRRLGGEIEQ